MQDHYDEFAATYDLEYGRLTDDLPFYPGLMVEPYTAPIVAEVLALAINWRHFIIRHTACLKFRKNFS